MLLVIGDHPLTPWEKIAIIFLGGSIVMITMLIVACIVFPTCALFKWLNRDEIKQEEELMLRKKKQPGPSYTNGNGYHSNGTKTHKTKFDFASRKAASTSDVRSIDSTYGSLLSGRNSPSNMSIKSAISNISLSSKSTTASSSSNSKEDITNVKVALNWQPSAISETKSTLITNVLEVTNIPKRSYSNHRDPFVVITIYKEKLTFTKKIKTILEEKKSKISRRTLNPIFNLKLVKDFILEYPSTPASDLKGIKIRITIHDYDKHSKVTELGAVTISTKMLLEAIERSNSGKDLVLELPMVPRIRDDLGSITFGLSYLPTSQRLAFSITKASNLRYDRVVEDLKQFYPFVRIIQVNSNGKVVRKKKTQTVIASKEPEFNETLNFELSSHQIEYMSFVVMIISKKPSSKAESASDRDEDSNQELYARGEQCLGQVSLGHNVSGQMERAHWLTVMTYPRKVFTNTFKLD